MIVNDVMIAMSVLSTFIMVRFHKDLSHFSFLFLTTGATALAYLVLTYSKLGEVNASSTQMLNSQKKTQAQLGFDDRKILRKYVKSSCPLKVHIGSFGYYRKPVTVRVVGKLITYTMKFLLMNKELS